MERTLLNLVSELNSLNDDNLADRIIQNNDVQWCLGELEDILEVIGDMPVSRLRELAQADREGRCVVLPCKIFDKVWNVAAHYQFEVTEIDLLPYGNILFRCGNKGTDDYAAFYRDDLGDTFTLVEPPERDNRVVKEAALRREQDGE